MPAKQDTSHHLTGPLIFLGPPGAGKGTQAREISRYFGIPHISTGDIFRENIEQGTPVGRHARTFMEKGELIPDDVVNTMVRERISQPDCGQGFLLDGYPRTLVQARSLQEMLRERLPGKPVVVNIQLSYTEIVERLSGRRICPLCQRTYNLRSQPPARDSVCDDDGTPLQQRPDDREEAIRERLQAYEAATSPLIGFYKNEARFVEVDGNQGPREITSSLTRILQDL